MTLNDLLAVLRARILDHEREIRIAQQLNFDHHIGVDESKWRIDEDKKIINIICRGRADAKGDRT